MSNLANRLLAAASTSGDRPALRQGDAVISYQQLDDLSARAAARLRRAGVAAGDRVGVMLPNITAFPPLYYGILRAGGVVVPMNPLLKSREISFHLRDSGAHVMFASVSLGDEAQKGAADAGATCVVVDPETSSSS